MTAPMPLVARQPATAKVADAVADVQRGNGRLLVITGEAGIGKTAIARWAAGHAASQGLLVARGAAVDDPGAPARWPWIRAGRELPVLAEALRPPEGSDGLASARFGLHVAVAAALRAAAETSGLLLVLEDVHWADPDSLALLRHLAGELAGLRLLVVVTVRTDPAVDVSSLVAGPDSALLPLVGLTAEDVVSWLHRSPGLSAWVPQAASLRDLTDGNPLYLRLVLDHLPWTDRPSADQVRLLLEDRPDLRSLVLARFDRLPSDVREVLAPASSQGEQIDVSTLAAVVGRPVGEVTALLDVAVSAGVLRAESGARFFRHALVRDAVYGRLPVSHRQTLHARIAAALAEQAGPMSAAPIAGHWRRAGGSSAELLHWSRLAAEQAAAAFAYDDAAAFAGQAASCAAELGKSPAERAEVIIEWADALFAAGQVPAALDAALQAAALAGAADRPDLIGAAALVVTGVGAPDVYRVVSGMCHQALAALPVQPSRLRARLLAQLAVASAEEATGPVAAELAAEALAAAEASGDAEAILEAIAARHYAISLPGTVDERIVLAERAITLASASNRVVAALWGHIWRIDAAFQLGDLDTVDRHLTAIEVLARQRNAPLARWHQERILATRSALIGDFASGRTHNEASRQLAARLDDVSLRGMYYAFRGQLAQVRGDPGDIDAHSLSVIEFAPPIPLVRIVRAVVPAIAGDRAAALAEFEEFRDLPRRLPIGTRWAATLWQIGILATMLDDAEVAADVYELLLPSAGYCTGDGSGAIFCTGSNARLLGDLAVTAGRYEDAVRLYTDAVAVNSRIGARPFTALSRLGWAQALWLAAKDGGGRAGVADDLRTARLLARQAAEQFRRLDMPGPLRRANALLSDIERASAANPLSTRENEVALLVADGLSNRAISERLFLSERTVESHVRSVLVKVGGRSRTDIATWALRAGLQ